MSIEVQSGSALADALQNVVGPKLAEAGWTSGAVDDNSLTEYIVLMLVNGKTQDQIASELAADLLGLPPDEPSTHEFARWLFEQLAVLNAQINGGIVPQVQQQSAHSGLGLPQGSTGGFGQGETNAPLQDTAMDEDGNDGSNDGPGAGTGAVPTGPKSMRNGTSAGNQQQQRGAMGAGGAGQGGRRMLGQLNKAMDRKSQDAASLHRIRAGGNAGRINTHGNREPPKGPRNMNNRMQNALGRGAGVMGAAGMNHQQQQQQQMQPGMNPAMAAGMMSADPQQQMQLLKLLEEQSRMMAQILGPGASQQFTPAINPAFFPNANAQQNQKGKSLFDRVDRKGPRHQNNAFNSKKFASSRNQDAMDTDAATDGAEASTTATGERKDASETACRWNLSCTNPACPFGHQSPAAPAGIVLDLTDKCTYGAACMNKKCVGSHPSPSQKRQHLATTVDCKFYPNCTNPSCPFKHPSTPPCRNGADCPERETTCKFSHSDMLCRYTPCLNPNCTYRHADGQKKGAVWTPESGAAAAAAKSKSDRVFSSAVEGEEELILPGKGPTAGDMDVEVEGSRDSATEGRASPDSVGAVDGVA